MPLSYTTRSGIVVVDNRRTALPPRDNAPNDNPLVDSGEPYSPEISVGPNASQGAGNSMVMSPNMPMDVQAWSGWPDGWATPAWNGMGGWQTRLDVVFACLDLNSSILATMPPYVVKGTMPQEAPTWLTNPEPLVYSGWTEFARSFWWSFQGTGEVIVYCTRRNAEGYPLRFITLNPAFVQIEVQDGIRHYALGGEDITADVLHVRYLTTSPDQAHGQGPLEAAGARMLAVEALSNLTYEMADRGGIPWAVLKVPKRLNNQQMRKMQSDWIEARRAAMGVPAILADGAELSPLTTPKDMALSEMSQFSEARLAVLLRVPPFLVGLPSGDSMTYSNVSSIFDYHWRSGLRPLASMGLDALSNWLLPRGTAIEVNRDEYVRPGFLERAQGYQIMAGIGALTVPEIRAMERFTTQSAPAALSATSPQAAVGTPPGAAAAVDAAQELIPNG
jgi:HK97 family phage portal protein